MQKTTNDKGQARRPPDPGMTDRRTPTLPAPDL